LQSKEKLCVDHVEKREKRFWAPVPRKGSRQGQSKANDPQEVGRDFKSRWSSDWVIRDLTKWPGGGFKQKEVRKKKSNGLLLYWQRKNGKSRKGSQKGRDPNRVGGGSI